MMRTLLLIDLDNIVEDMVLGKGRFRQQIGGLEQKKDRRGPCAVVVAANNYTLELLANRERITGTELPEFIRIMARAVGLEPDVTPEFAFWPSHPQAADTLLVRALAGTPVFLHSEKFLPYAEVLVLAGDKGLRDNIEATLAPQRPHRETLTWGVPGMLDSIAAGWRFTLEDSLHRPFLPHAEVNEEGHPADGIAIPASLASPGDLAEASRDLDNPDNWTLVSGSGGSTLPSIERLWSDVSTWGEARPVDEAHDATRWGPARPVRIDGVATEEVLPLALLATSSKGSALVRSRIPPSLLAIDLKSVVVDDGHVNDHQWLLDHEQVGADQAVDVHFKARRKTIERGRAVVGHKAPDLPAAWWLSPGKGGRPTTRSERKDVPTPVDATVRGIPYVFDGRVVLAAQPDDGEITLSQRLPKGVLHLEQGRIIYSRRGANAGDEIEVCRAQELTLASTEHYLWDLPVWVHVPSAER